VNTPRTPYHHGNLSEALLSAGVQLAREGGPDAVVLREASRRAGVSHNAVYRHFADRDALLRAVCGECMNALAHLMQRRIAEVDPRDGGLVAARSRLAATGAAYVEFASTEPGWFRTAFSVPPGLDYLQEGEVGGPDSVGPLGLLGAELDALVAAGGLPAERRPLAEIAAWASVHGLAMLLLDGPLRELSAEERDAALARLLDTIERGL
jgi:AcrR family transcriptional regulator